MGTRPLVSGSDHDAILDRYHAGERVLSIAAAYELTEGSLFGLLERSRLAGDPRAWRKGDQIVPTVKRKSLAAELGIESVTYVVANRKATRPNSPPYAYVSLPRLRCLETGR